MLSLVYISKSLIGKDQHSDALDDIQAIAIARNSSLDITGLLIATPQYFAQLLEGPAPEVDTVMASILADPRHHEVRIVRRSEVAAARYPLWRMARFEGENFGKVSITPLLAAAHRQVDAAANLKLDRLIAQMAGAGSFHEDLQRRA